MKKEPMHEAKVAPESKSKGPERPAKMKDGAIMEHGTRVAHSTEKHHEIEGKKKINTGKVMGKDTRVEHMKIPHEDKGKVGPGGKLGLKLGQRVTSSRAHTR